MRVVSATLLAVCLMLLLAAGGAAQATDGVPRAPVTIRVLSYNIQHGMGADGRIDLPRLAAVMKAANPDIVALQEVDQANERSGGVKQLDELARLMGMHAEFGKAIDYLGGGYGVGTLSRWPITSPDNQQLPSPPNIEARTLLTVSIRIGAGGPWIRFANTHLDQSRTITDRLPMVARIDSLLAPRADHPTILAGDFNTRGFADVLDVLDPRWINALQELMIPPTPSGPRTAAPSPRSDYVLFRPASAWRVVEAQVIDNLIASDHRPVLVVLELVTPP